MNKFEYLAVIFAICGLFSLLYWQVVQFVILKRVRFQLFEMRDKVRRIAGERGIIHDEHFRYIERFICKTITYSPSISFTSFVLFATLKHKDIDADTDTAKEMARFSNEAPQEFVSIRESTAKLSLIIMCLNSPWMVVFGSAAAFMLVALGKLSRLGIYSKAEKFVEHIDSPADGCPSPV